MNCPVCDRSLAPTLSICPTCGAMMNDTVREELQTKIMPSAAVRTLPTQTEEREVQRSVEQPSAVPQSKAEAQPKSEVQPKTLPKRPVETAGLSAPKTSPTLVEFQNKRTTVPDWRLQLQNAVQQRRGAASASTDRAPVLKTAAAPVAVPEPAVLETAVSGMAAADPRVANAMRRIAESRKAFAGPEAVAPRPAKARPTPVRSLGIVPNDIHKTREPSIAPSVAVRAAKPRLVEREEFPVKRETNKLPQINVPAAPAQSGQLTTPGSGNLVREAPEAKRIQIRADVSEPLEHVDVVTEDIEDLAPFSMRFGAGLFDMIIAVFATMLLVSPIAFTNPNWFTMSGLLTFAGACAIFVFVYMTACLGFFGKTAGMRLFSLELVDAVENEYPTLHQAAVSSSVFILSLIVGGLGFVTVFFNEEKRAVHDLLSGTILVRDF
jgi:uncharacterized RDD family membrane protein YckC